MESPKTVMYIFINKGLGMSSGKMASQAAHAAVLASDGSKPKLKKAWNSGGHYCKLVMEARDTEHLQLIDRYIHERGFKTFPVIDEGLTEVDVHSFTALGVEIVDKNIKHVEDTFSSFSLYSGCCRHEEAIEAFNRGLEKEASETKKKKSWF